MSDAYARLMDRVRDIGRFRAIEALLEWDQETYMPPGGVKARAEQIALIAGVAHERMVADETKALLEEAAAHDEDYVAVTNLRETRRTFDRASKVPTELVKEIAHTSAMAKEAWVKARKDSDFPTFAPLLGKMVDLKKQLADHVGYETEPYDALMDEFEPGARAADIDELFATLRDQTVALLRKIQAASDKPDAAILTRHYPQAQQEVLSRQMATALNFDFDSGRGDVTVHPFCTTIGGCDDVRITTRYLEDFLPAAMFGTMHETGHGLYEQGLPVEHRFTPMGDCISLGIHESQSRMWENMVGRSRGFWEHHYAGVQVMFPDALGDVSLDAFYRAINTVAPSFIRVEADELTYNLHIALRFEIERGIFTGKLKIEDIPAAWSEAFDRFLGVTPDNDAEGCLQDIHWSMGIFGYFPTYALGNLYAAQFFGQAEKDIPDLANRIRANDHKPLLAWLREHIHQHGMRYRAGELVEKVTGKPLSIEPFMGYVTAKFSEVYGL